MRTNISVARAVIARGLLIAVASLPIALTPMAAEADVIYNWVDVVPNSFTGPATGSIRFDEAYWSAQGFAVGTVCGTPCGTSTQPLYIKSFHFGTSVLGVNYDFLNPNSYSLARYSVGLGTTLVGSFQVNNSFSEVNMATTSSDIWTVSLLSAEAGYCNGGPPICLGATGRWVLDLNSVPPAVPEPSRIALTLLGLLTLGILKRKFA